MAPTANSKSLSWIESTGGPLLLLERELLPYWHGILENGVTGTDYDRACRIADYVGAIEVGPGVGLILGEEPFSTTWWQSEDLLNSFLVRWVCAEDEAKVRAVLSSLSSGNQWQPTDVRILVDSELILFDSSCPGTDIDDYLTIKIAAGRYTVETLYYSPNDELSLILHRFVPRPSAQLLRHTDYSLQK